MTAYDATRESSYSVDVSATPRVVAGPPAALPAGGLVLLLDAGNAALGAADGSPVTTWRDASGGGRDAVATAGRAPILVTGALGGDAVLRFDGQDDGMDLPAGFTDFTAGLSMFVVARPTAVQSGSKLVLLGSGAGQGNVSLGRNGEGAGLQYFTTDSGGNYGWFATADALSTNEAAVYGVVQGGGAANSAVTATVSRNGVAVGSGTVWVPPVVSRTQNRIGHSYWGGDGTFAGDVAEVIVYNRALTATEQSAVTSYLLDKYGLGGAPLPPLGVPSTLSATVGDGQATLGWGAVSGATGYRLYRRVGAGAYVNVYQGTATGYTDTGLANGTTYGYVVTAYDATRESAYSSEVQATPTGALLPPGALSATAGDGQATLGWGAVSGATGYRVYRRVGAGAYVNVYQGTATGYTDTGLMNGTTYGYVVTAYDATRESGYSAEVLATPMVVLMPPTALPAGGLVLLLDAGNAALGAADGSPVTTWRDASGGGRDAVATAGRAPILVTGSLGGDAVLRFDGQDDGMDLPAGFTDFTAGLSMFVVARPTAVQSGSKLVLLGSGAGQGNVSLGRNGEGAGLQYFTTDSGGNYGWFATADALSTNEAAVYGVVQGGGAANSAVTATVSRNGVAVGSGTVWVPPVVSRTQNRIGHSYWGGDGTFAGDVAEVIVYNRALTATEQSAVTSYLLDKYGLGDTTPPAVTTLTPANGATGVPLATQIIATFSEPIDPATIAAVELRDASSVVVPANASYNAASNTVTLTPISPLASSTLYTVVVRGGATDPRIKDVAGNALAQDVSASFTTLASDVTPPTVIAVSPANGSAGFVRTANVTATFSEAMDAATISGTTVVLRDAANAIVAATVTYSASTRMVTLNPTPTLGSGANYTVVIIGGAAGVKDLAGNAMTVDHVWSFTTEVDLTPPTITATTPADGAVGVIRTSNVTATFSEAMDSTTINATTFVLRDATDAVVPATVSYSTSSRVATLNPTPTLNSGATYRVTIVGGGSGAKDLAGNALAVDRVWSFTAEVDSTPPSVSTKSPAAGVTGRQSDGERHRNVQRAHGWGDDQHDDIRAPRPVERNRSGHGQLQCDVARCNAEPDSDARLFDDLYCDRPRRRDGSTGEGRFRQCAGGGRGLDVHDRGRRNCADGQLGVARERRHRR